jgi:hypothetical protein
MKLNFSFPNIKKTNKNVKSNSLSCTIKDKSFEKEHDEPNKPRYFYIGMRKKNNLSNIITKEASFF